MQRAVEQGIAAEPLAWLIGLWPLLAVHGAWLISLNAGLIPACIPYVEGCTSISRAGASRAHQRALSSQNRASRPT